MGKVGICACYNTLNYGSMLQSFATEYIINELGYDCEFIRYRKKLTIIFVLKQIPRCFNLNLIYDKKTAIRKKVNLYKNEYAKKIDQERREKFEQFQNNFYKKFSRVYYGYNDLKTGASSYSSVLVGSDQLWTPGGLATNFYNLLFVPDKINKISYATSFGVSNIPFYQRKRTKKYLMRIDHLSVREEKGKEIIAKLTGRKAKVVLDPTLLLTREQWDEAVPYERIIDKPYVFCYFLGENNFHREVASDICEKTGLAIVTTPFLDSVVKCDVHFGDFRLAVGPDGFVNLIRNAKYVITDSFHGTVFSILYHKKFVTLNRYEEGSQSRNSRIDNILTILGLENRRSSCPDLDLLSEIINYDLVDEKISLLREDSLDFLREALSCGLK